MNVFMKACAVAVCAALLCLALPAQRASAPVPPFRVFDQAVITHTERAEVYPGIAHYKFLATVGPGEYDKVRIHRVVREAQAGKPSPDTGAVMLLPGLPNHFFQLYLPPIYSDAPERDQSIAIYLAKNGVDVWGMDYAWELVPKETKDFAFMKEWGYETDVAHVQVALRFARLTRWMGGFGPAPLFLSGLHYGAALTYKVTAEESLRSPFFRNVKGMIPMDVALFLDDEELRTPHCTSAAAQQRLIDQGNYVISAGPSRAELAISDPDGPSSAVPGVTNHQAAIMGATIRRAPLSWQFVAGEYDESGRAFRLRFTPDRLWFDLIVRTPYHYPRRLAVVTDADKCLAIATPHYNPLRHIRVPLLYVGAVGGFGRFGEFTVKQTRSRDVQMLIVQTLPEEQRHLDYGVADLVLASEAQQLVWKPILDWIKAHR